MSHVRYHRPPLGDVPALVGDVTTWLSELEHTVQGVQTQVTKINNAVKGAAVGAKSGYDAPTDWKPVAIGVGVVAFGLFLLRKLA